MNNNYTYIDFDGVILDSEERMLDRKYNAGFHDHKNEKEFDDYFNYTNSHPEEWDYIIRKANPINNSVEIIKELESLKKRIAILTKIHTLYEMKVKIEDIRIVKGDNHYLTSHAFKDEYLYEWLKKNTKGC